MARSLAQIRRGMQSDYKCLQSWRLVAQEWKVTKGMAYRIAMQNYEPKKPEIRRQLGLPLPSARVIAIGNVDIPDGTQVAGVRRCVQCGASLAHDHPGRVYCFECHPPRKNVAHKQCRAPQHKPQRPSYARQGAILGLHVLVRRSKKGNER